MATQSLHPNLARIASHYDNIVERFRNQQIDATRARSEILSLVARDDNGVQWSLDPDTGEWYYRNIKNQLVKSDPPSYGLATPTAHDLSRNPDAYNPDSNIQFQEVDESLLHPPNSLIGSTRRREEPKKSAFGTFLNTKVGKGLVCVLIAVAAFFAFNELKERDAQPAAPVPPAVAPPVEAPPAVPPPA